MALHSPSTVDATRLVSVVQRISKFSPILCSVSLAYKLFMLLFVTCSMSWRTARYIMPLSEPRPSIILSLFTALSVPGCTRTDRKQSFHRSCCRPMNPKQKVTFGDVLSTSYPLVDLTSPQSGSIATQVFTAADCYGSNLPVHP